MSIDAAFYRRSPSTQTVSDVGSKMTVPNVRRNDAPNCAAGVDKAAIPPQPFGALQNQVKGRNAQDRSPFIRFDHKGNILQSVDVAGLSAFAGKDLYVPNMIKLHVTVNQLFK